MRNALERLNISCAQRDVFPQDLSFLQSSASEPSSGGALGQQVADIEKRTILETYRKSGNNKLRTAQALGVSRNRLKRKLEEYQIDDD